MPNTTNFNFPTPADTDLVKDGASAIRSLGNSIDTAFVDLKGGTTGQILSKASNTDLDYTWIANDQGDITEVQAGTGISVASGTGPIPVVTNTVATTFDAKGDLVAGTGADTFSKLTVGANNTVLTADSTTATGLKWAATSAGALVLTGSSDFSASSSVIITNCFSSTYDFYVMYLDLSAAANGTDWGISLRLRVGGTSAATNYDLNRIYWNASPATVSNSTGATAFGFSEGSTTNPTRTATVTEFVDPALARATKIFSKSVAKSNAGTNGASLWFGAHTTATAYDSLEIFPESPTTITGTVRIYGYAKS